MGVFEAIEPIPVRSSMQSDDARTQPSQRTRPNTVLAIAALSSFINPFMLSALNVALPELSAELELDAVTLSWVPTSFLLASAVVLVPAGRIGDIVGRKRVFLTGVALLQLATLGCALASSATVLLLSRILQGGGAALIMATSLAILTAVFPPQKRGRVIGIAVAAVYVGLSAGPFLGGLLTQQFGWRSIFWSYLPLGGLLLVLALIHLKGEWADARGESVDKPGTALYALALITLMYGISLLPSWRGTGMAAAGLVLFGAFVYWQTRTRNPLVSIELFRDNRSFAFSSLAALINYSATFSFVFLLSLYLQYVHELTPRSAGVVLVAQPITMALLSPVAGRLSDRHGSRTIATVGMGLTGAGLILLTFVGIGTGLAFIIACAILLGTGFALFSSPNMSAIIGAVERRQYGLASGTVSTMRLLGQMLSMGVATTVMAILVGREAITPENQDAFLRAMRICFVISAGLCGLGIPASLARGTRRSESESGESQSGRSRSGEV